jgi:hypothetical protein
LNFCCTVRLTLPTHNGATCNAINAGADEHDTHASKQSRHVVDPVTSRSGCFLVSVKSAEQAAYRWLNIRAPCNTDSHGRAQWEAVAEHHAVP